MINDLTIILSDGLHKTEIDIKQNVLMKNSTDTFLSIISALYLRVQKIDFEKLTVTLIGQGETDELSFKTNELTVIQYIKNNAESTLGLAKELIITKELNVSSLDLENFLFSIIEEKF